jgi:hypothetical protein
MRKIVLIVGVAVAALPAIALADSLPAQSAAKKQYRHQQTAMEKAVSKQTYDTKKNRSNAFGKCVSHRTAQNTTDQSAAQTNAAKQCRAEQSAPSFAASHNGDTFDQFYGTGAKDKNAFGKCVSTKAKALSAQAESSQVSAENNAAKLCRSEQSSDPAAFETKYGTNHNKSKAFGKCVSQKARAQERASS